MSSKEKTYLEILNNDSKKLLNITESLNPAYSKLLSSKLYTAISVIVDSNGNGTYRTIQEAVDSGATKIVIKNGTYSITSDLELTNQYLIGETQNGVIINLSNSSIIFKEVSNKSSGGTVQFEEEDRTVDGDNTSFTSLSNSDDNKYLYSDGRYFEIDKITSSILLELKTKIYGTTEDAVDSTVLEKDQISFEAEALSGGIENLTINHSITKIKSALIINGFNIKIKNVKFFENSGLSNFITISNSNVQMALKTIIESCYFEGGVNPISINQAFLTTIEKCYFTSFKEKAIELFSQSEYTTIIGNIFVSGQYGIIGNTKNLKIVENIFSYIKENAIKLNYNSYTNTFNSIQIIYNSFHYSNEIKSYTTNGSIAIRGSGNIISNNSFYKCTRCVNLNCKNSVLSETEDRLQTNSDGLNIFGDNNIIANFSSDKIVYDLSSSTAEHSIFDGISANGDTTLAILKQGNYSIAMNIVHLSEEYYHNNNSILMNSLTKLSSGTMYSDSYESTFDNDIQDDDFAQSGDSNIAAFNMILNPNNAIDCQENSVCKGNLVEGINPPVTDSAANNIEIHNYF